MINHATFTLSDLTKEFFSKLCYVEQMQSTGLGGAGYILMVTEDGWEYLLGIEGYDEYNPQNTVPLLTSQEKWDEIKLERRKTVEYRKRILHLKNCVTIYQLVCWKHYVTKIFFLWMMYRMLMIAIMYTV